MFLLKRSLLFAAAAFFSFWVCGATASAQPFSAAQTGNLFQTAPAADFSAEPLSGYMPLTVSFTSMASGDITLYEWAFGDGGTSAEGNPVHTYQEPGSFSVRLYVGGPQGEASELKQDYITVKAPTPVADFSAKPTKGPVPLTVVFTDLSSEGGGQIQEWIWDFGDGQIMSYGTRADQVVHTYKDPGTYTVSLSVINSQGSDSKVMSDYITVTGKVLKPDFTAQPRSGSSPLTVQFTDATIGEPVQWLWDFGDGSTGIEQNPVHIYQSTAQYIEYDVSLTVTDAARSVTILKPFYIQVTPEVPRADFFAAPVSGDPPLTVQFTDNSSGEIFEWGWNFGDGPGDFVQNPVHTYAIPGTYPVNLRVIGPYGSDEVTVKDCITVNRKPGTYDISGTVTGQSLKGVLMDLIATDKEDVFRVVQLAENGTYAFRGLYPATYAIAPLSGRHVFEPQGRTVTLKDGDVTGIDFQGTITGVAVEEPKAEPSDIEANAVSTLLLSAKVTSPGGGEITSVTIDLSPIGGTAPQKMYDDGTNGDASAGDSVYSFQTTVARGTPPGYTPLPLKAANTRGEIFKTGIELNVISVINESLSGTKDNTINSMVKGQTLQVTFSSSPDFSARVVSAASEGGFFMDILRPDGTAWRENIPVMAEEAELDIKNADAGDWTFRMRNTGSTARTYSLSTTTAGTGVISGSISAEDGSGISGAVITTAAGASTLSQEGYFLLLAPAGIHALQATSPGYVQPYVPSVTVSAGGSAEQDIVMKEGGADNNGTSCLAVLLLDEFSFRGELMLLRSFRDRVLKQTPRGRNMVAAYYSLSPEAGKLLQKNPALMSRCKNILLQLVPRIEDMLSGRAAHMPQALLRECAVFLADFEKAAPPQLRDKIAPVRTELESFQEKGIIDLPDFIRRVSRSMAP